MKRAIQLALPLLAACSSYTTHLTATPLAPGKTELGATVSGLIVERGAVPSLIPQGEISLRHGLTETIDAGLELNALGGELNLRIQLLAADGLVLSVVPSAGFELAPLTNIDADLWRLRFGSTLLLDVELTPRFTAVFGLKPLAAIGPRPGVWSGDPARARLIFAPGAMVGCRLALGERWGIFPELDVHAPWDVSDNRLEALIVQGGIGLDFRFGGG